MKLKTGSVGQKMVRKADACMLYSFATPSTFSAVHAVFAYNFQFWALFPIAQSSDSPHTWVRLLINFTELSFRLLSKFGNNCSERNITWQI